MKRIVVAIAMAVAVGLTIPSLASANMPSAADRADAKGFAQAYWADKDTEYRCDHLDVSYEFFRAKSKIGVMGYVLMSSDRCHIHLNRKVRWNWSNLCYTMIHELGHVLGKGHSSDPKSIMYWRYPNERYGGPGRRHPACEFTYEDPAPAPAPAPEPYVDEPAPYVDDRDYSYGGARGE